VSVGLRVRTCVVLGLIGLPVCSTAADVQTYAARHGESYEIEASARLDADVQVAWDVLTDYERLPEFIPGIHSSKVVSRHGGEVLLDQRGMAGLWFLSFPVEVRLAIVEMPPERVESRAIAGNFKEMRGTYRLEAQESGLRLYFSGMFTPDFSIPPVIGTMVVRHSLEQRFRAMVDEILRRQAAMEGRTLPESGS
jgi:ribosome-associated toxin RatA of RatAB toxin-antitoxin module